MAKNLLIVESPAKARTIKKYLGKDFEVMASLVPLISPEEYLPILVLTGDDGPDARRRALAAGAMDFLTKPFEHFEAEDRWRTTRWRRPRHRPRAAAPSPSSSDPARRR